MSGVNSEISPLLLTSLVKILVETVNTRPLLRQIFIKRLTPLKVSNSAYSCKENTVKFARSPQNFCA